MERFMADARIPGWIIDLESDDFDAQWEAINGLADHGDETAIPVLLRVGLNPSQAEDVQYYAWEALRNISGVETFVEHMVRAIHDHPDDASVRDTAVTALAEFGNASALPSLIEVAGRDPVVDVQRTALHAIGVHGTGEMVAFLQDFLEHDEAMLRTAAGEALRHLDPGAVNPANLLSDPSWEVRRDACMQLAKHPDPSTFELLLAMFQDASQPSPLRFKAAEALGALRDVRAVDPMIAVLENAEEDEDTRTTCARQLGHFEDERAVAPLCRYLHATHDGDSHSEAAIGLGYLGSSSAVPALIEATTDERPSVREWSLDALGKLKAAQAYDAVMARLEDEDPQVRAYAAAALGDIGDVRAVDALIALVTSPGRPGVAGGVRPQAAWALGRLGDDRAIEPLAKAIDDDDFMMRTHAIEALAVLKARTTINRIVARLSDENFNVVSAAISAVAQLGDESHLEALGALDGDRTDALGARAKLGDESARQLLREALDDPEVSHQAACELVSLGDVYGLTLCIEALHSRYYNVRMHAIRALGTHGSQEARAALEALADDPDYEIRATMRAFLLRLAEAESESSSDPGGSSRG